MRYPIDPGNGDTRTAWIDGRKSTHMGIKITQFGLIIGYRYGPDFLKPELRARIKKSRIHVLAGSVDLLIIGRNVDISAHPSNPLIFN